jgi:toxin ParE1/3/4
VEYQVIWSPNALECLDKIGLFIVLNDGVVNAERVVSKIFTKGGTLAKFPGVGRPVPEFPGSSFRQALVVRYRIIYEVNGSSVNILSIVHSSKVLKGLEA